MAVGCFFAVWEHKLGLVSGRVVSIGSIYSLDRYL
jgi:hypothetical protein